MNSYWDFEITRFNSPALNFFCTYLLKIWLKITETVLSVKVMGLISSLYAGIWLLMNDYITSSDFVSFITPIWVTIFGVREIWKIGRVFIDKKQSVISTITQTVETPVKANEESEA